MALVNYNLRVVRDYLTKLDRDSRRLGRAACLSHPDVVCSDADLVELFGERVRTLPVRADADLTLNWHKAHAVCATVYDTTALFAMLGYALTCFDLVEGRGGEVRCDLSLPLSAKLHRTHAGRYDLLFDCISNQVFNAAQCLANAWALLRVGGVAVHCVPATMTNQGFWNISPCLFPDFYAANGGEVRMQRLVRGVYTHQQELCPDTVRMRGVPDDAMNLIVAVKHEARAPCWPIMSKFIRYPTCQIARVDTAEEVSGADSAPGGESALAGGTGISGGDGAKPALPAGAGERPVPGGAGAGPEPGVAPL